MAKIYGLFGSMTGKLADTVMSVRNGEQIARKYQPIVFNPSTPAQMAQRAKMKLLSQLSAVFGNVIAMRREGSASARNIFTKVNFPKATYSNNEANLTLTELKLTRSVVNMLPLTATRNGGVVSVALETTSAAYDKVVYIFVGKGADGEIRVEASKVVDGTGEQFIYDTTQTVRGAEKVYVFAYGIRFNNDTARAKYGDMMVDASSVAELIVSRIVNDSDITYTETVAVEVTESREPDEKETKKK